MDGAHLAHRPLDRTAPRGDRPAERNGVLHVDIIIIARGGEGSLWLITMCGVCGWSIGAEKQILSPILKGKPESQYRCMDY